MLSCFRALLWNRSIAGYKLHNLQYKLQSSYSFEKAVVHETANYTKLRGILFLVIIIFSKKNFFLNIKKRIFIYLNLKFKFIHWTVLDELQKWNGFWKTWHLIMFLLLMGFKTRLITHFLGNLKGKMKSAF